LRIRGGRTRSDSKKSVWSVRVRIRLNLILKKKSNWSDPRSNDIQSNRNLLKIWKKNTTYKLIQSDLILTQPIRPDFFQKIKLTRPVQSESKPEPNRPAWWWLLISAKFTCMKFQSEAHTIGPVVLGLFDSALIKD
jgi:hypothetical protein